MCEESMCGGAQEGTVFVYLRLNPVSAYYMPVPACVNKYRKIE